MIGAVVFDLDGVLLDSEQMWDRSRRDVVAEHGGSWTEEATAAMQGMSSKEWAAYIRQHLGVDRPEEQIVDSVVGRLLESYHHDLPLLPGAREAVARMAARWPLAIASSSNRIVIDEVLTLAGLLTFFDVTVSSEEVARGKPAPDVYLEVAHRMRRPPRRCVAVEDSASGIRAAAAAGLRVVAIPNPHFPPGGDVLEAAGLVLASLDELTVDRLEESDRQAVDRLMDEVEDESFPASDPHADWAGPPE